MKVGTSVYMSPELLRLNQSAPPAAGSTAATVAANSPDPTGTMSGYDAEHSDIWACGVLLYVMLLGRLPFEGRSVDTVHKRVARGVQSNQPFTGAYIPVGACSPDCRDLMSKIFVPDETDGKQRRLTIEEIKTHPWFTQALPEPYNKDILAAAPTPPAGPQSPETALPATVIVTEPNLSKLVTDATHLPTTASKILRSWRPVRGGRADVSLPCRRLCIAHSTPPHFVDSPFAKAPVGPVLTPEPSLPSPTTSQPQHVGYKPTGAPNSYV